MINLQMVLDIILNIPQKDDGVTVLIIEEVIVHLEITTKEAVGMIEEIGMTEEMIEGMIIIVQDEEMIVEKVVGIVNTEEIEMNIIEMITVLEEEIDTEDIEMIHIVQ